MNHSISYLALGDSYTIGESVPLHESFPYLTTQLIRKQKIAIHAPEIIAKTGWTSSELAEQLLKTELNTHYDFISLLIGVNNQYRHLSLHDFRSDFEYLLKKSIHLSNGKPQNVIILSIPDWGCTSFNHVCAQFAKDYHTQFIDITTATRALKDHPSALAADQLHYSGETHLLWANKVANKIMELSK
jgi:hypothetical protein